jgi:predicted glycosyltransferase
LVFHPPPNINNPDAKMLKVLVAPLDWGLGHATRCIPIIKEFVNQRCTVIIAAAGAQKAVLQEEFPDLSFVEIPGFRIKYGKNRAFTLLKIIFAVPKILIGIKRENQWLRRFAGQEGIDLVISDNRFGLYGGVSRSIFVTHQLAIRSSLGGVADWLLRRMNYRYIRRYSVCWVPDREGDDNLAGKLSHPGKMPEVEVKYIGWLSRLTAPAEDSGDIGEDAVDLLILLSGPEPQRNLLEGIVLAQLMGGIGSVVVVRGLPRGGGAVTNVGGGVEIFDHLPARELTRVISRSLVIIARSGYSTVMDLVRLGRKAVYIPTPGQPEQEYLGDYLETKGWGVCVKQRGFDLHEAVARGRHLATAKPAAGDERLKAEIAGLLAELRGQSGVADLG